MNRQGFVDANGYSVEIGTLVEYQDKRFAEVTDLTQDGDVWLLFLDGERMQTKWRTVARLPEDIASQIHAARSTPNPAGKVAGYTPQPDAKVAVVNIFKFWEERILREMDRMQAECFADAKNWLDAQPKGEYRNIDWNNPKPPYDENLLRLARKQMTVAFMLLNRSVFQPQRIRLPEDGE